MYGKKQFKMFLYFIIRFIQIWRNNICNKFHIHQEFLELFVFLCVFVWLKMVCDSLRGCKQEQIIQKLTARLYSFAEIQCPQKSQALETKGKVWSKLGRLNLGGGTISFENFRSNWMYVSLRPWRDAPLTACGAGWCQCKASWEFPEVPSNNLKQSDSVMLSARRVSGGIPVLTKLRSLLC